MKSEYAMLAVANNADFQLKYIYHDEFNNTENIEALDLTKLEVHDFQVGRKTIIISYVQHEKKQAFSKCATILLQNL